MRCFSSMGDCGAAPVEPLLATYAVGIACETGAGRASGSCGITIHAIRYPSPPMKGTGHNSRTSAIIRARLTSMPR